MDTALVDMVDTVDTLVDMVDTMVTAARGLPNTLGLPIPNLKQKAIGPQQQSKPPQ